jgi:hypothetical protein
MRVVTSAGLGLVAGGFAVHAALVAPAEPVAAVMAGLMALVTVWLAVKSGRRPRRRPAAKRVLVGR